MQRWITRLARSQLSVREWMELWYTGAVVFAAIGNHTAMQPRGMDQTRRTTILSRRSDTNDAAANGSVSRRRAARNVLVADLLGLRAHEHRHGFRHTVLYRHQPQRRASEAPPGREFACSQARRSAEAAPPTGSVTMVPPRRTARCRSACSSP
jgi:hypothetical protein